MLKFAYHIDYILRAYRDLSVIRPQGDSSEPVAFAIAAFVSAAEDERFDEVQNIIALLAMPLAEEGLDDGIVYSAAFGGSMSLTIVDHGCGCSGPVTGVPAEKLERALELVGMHLSRAQA